MNSVVHHSVLFAYGKVEQGDPFLIFKNPQKLAADLHSFCSAPDACSLNPLALPLGMGETFSKKADQRPNLVR